MAVSHHRVYVFSTFVSGIPRLGGPGVSHARTVRFDRKQGADSQGSCSSNGVKGLLAEVAAFERIRRKHSAEQEDRCGILHQQLVAEPLRRDGILWGIRRCAESRTLLRARARARYTWYIANRQHEPGYSWF